MWCCMASVCMNPCMTSFSYIFIINYSTNFLMFSLTRNRQCIIDVPILCHLSNPGSFRLTTTVIYCLYYFHTCLNLFLSLQQMHRIIKDSSFLTYSFADILLKFSFKSVS